jgi:hypothetical protein
MGARKKQRKRKFTNAQVEALATRALEHIQSVDYKVSLRWVFYRLLQDGFYKEKSDYNRFMQLTSKWRHKELFGWRPDTLADETCEIIIRGVEVATPFEEIPDSIIQNLPLWTLDSHFKYQDYYIEVWFEARAMLEQFQKYAPHVTLYPFGGWATIDPKYQTAKRLEKMYVRFKKPIVILYFGDCDNTGKKIPKASITGVKGLEKWCKAPFTVKRCGLNVAQAKKYKIPERIDEPGEFQWEALEDEQAGKIITSSVNQYLKQEPIERVLAESKAMNNKIGSVISKSFKDLGGKKNGN